MELYWHHLPPKATTAATTSTSSASTPTHMVKKPLPPHATAATSPSGTSTVDISNAELARLCSKLSGKELGRYFKRLRDPQVISPKNNEHKEQAAVLLNNIMKVLLRPTSPQDRDVLLEVLPLLMLAHDGLRFRVFDWVLTSSNTSNSNSSSRNTNSINLLHASGTNNVLHESIVLTFEQRPSIVYHRLSDYIEHPGAPRSTTLLVLGRLVLKYRRHARRITETGAWPALISVLRTENEKSVM